MSITPELTTTSYAVLGLLAIQPWGTYELAKQMERSLRQFWPRAESRVYEEPKRLVALGLARAKSERVGRRPRTVYSITAKGRRALEAWLATPGAGPSLECEQLVKVFFSDHGSKEGAALNVAALREWARARNAESIGFARATVAGDNPFPERLPQILLMGRFLVGLADMVEHWADWAEKEIAGWPDDPADAEPDWAFAREVAAREPA